MKVPNWSELHIPWIECEGLPDYIKKNIRMADLFDYFGIDYGAGAAGNFTHRTSCPLNMHGGDRTPSFYFDDVNAKFHCFGCNGNGDIIDFVKMYMGIPYYEALRFFVEKFKIDIDKIEYNDTKKENLDPKKTSKFYIDKAGVMLRKFLKKLENQKSYEDNVKWADEIFQKLDVFWDKIEDHDWEKAKKAYDRILTEAKSRYENRHNW